MNSHSFIHICSLPLMTSVEWEKNFRCLFSHTRLGSHADRKSADTKSALCYKSIKCSMRIKHRQSTQLVMHNSQLKHFHSKFPDNFELRCYCQRKARGKKLREMCGFLKCIVLTQMSLVESEFVKKQTCAL